MRHFYVPSRGLSCFEDNARKFHPWGVCVGIVQRIASLILKLMHLVVGRIVRASNL